MGIKKFKPTSPGRRNMSSSDFADVSADRPLKRLTSALRRKGGRNVYGRITVRRRGGGHKRRYRVIDFKRTKFAVPARVATIEYDPNRSARIALLHYADGAKTYILAPKGLRVGDEVVSSRQADIKPGNSLPLRNIPVGTECTRLSSRSVAAPRCVAPRVPGHSCWPRSRIGRPCVCPPARCAWCTSTAAARSVVWATRSTATSSSARRVAHAGLVVVPRFVVWP